MNKSKMLIFAYKNDRRVYLTLKIFLSKVCQLSFCFYVFVT